MASPACWFNLKRVVLRSEATYNPGSGKRGPKPRPTACLKSLFPLYFSKVFILLYIFFLPCSLSQVPRASNSQCCGDTLPFSWVNTNVMPWYRHWWSVMTLEWRTDERLRGEMSRSHKDVLLTQFKLKRRKVKRRWTWMAENIRIRLSTKKQTSADQHGQQILWNISISLTFEGVPIIYYLTILAGSCCSRFSRCYDDVNKWIKHLLLVFLRGSFTYIYFRPHIIYHCTNDCNSIPAQHVQYI